MADHQRYGLRVALMGPPESYIADITGAIEEVLTFAIEHGKGPLFWETFTARIYGSDFGRLVLEIRVEEEPVDTEEEP